MLAAIALAAAMLWTPLSRLGTHTLGPWDTVTSGDPFLRPKEPVEVANHALTDPVRQFLPWVELARREFEEGRLPLWNEYNAGGQPLLANYQSALLSPFTLPFYVLPLDLATVLSAWAKLACAAFFTFGLLRSLGFGRWPAAFGAAAYTCIAGHLMLLLHPHPGVTALLPALLWCIERAVRAAEEGQRGALWRRCAVLGLVTGISALAGHPEMLMVSAGVCAAFLAARAIASSERRRVLRALPLLATGALLGALLAAPQIVPFAEYLRLSLALARQRGAPSPSRMDQLPFAMFPALVGSPLSPAPGVVMTPKVNYQDSLAYYAGALPVWLSCLALMLGAARTRFGLLVAGGLLALGIGSNVGGFGETFGHWISFGLVPAGRFYPVLAVGGALASA